MSIHEANRMRRLPLYLFTITDELKEKAKAKGVDVIDLGMGSPDMPTPKHIVDELCIQARITENQRYSRPNGIPEMILKEAIAQWYKGRFKVELDPRTEVLPLIGSKEGVAHLSLAFLNHDDIALVPNPAYPVHFNGVIMAGGILYNIPMTAEHHFKPDLRSLSPELLRMAKLLFLSYPHNPTTSVADINFFKDVVKWAKDKPNIIIAHDLTYSDIVFDGFYAPSILEVEGAKEMNIIEFHTLSKSYNMAGWRIGFAVGNRDILASLAKTKSYIDFGIFRAIQLAAAKALTGPQDCVKELVEVYRKRRDVLVDGLNSIGWQVEKPKGTFYVWAHIPPKYNALTSMEFAALLVEEAGVVAAPGTGFGEYGEGYVRFALIEKEERLSMAVQRLNKLLKTED
jgi:aspartate/methionine/tyrosine aminotransferase